MYLFCLNFPFFSCFILIEEPHFIDAYLVIQRKDRKDLIIGYFESFADIFCSLTDS